MSSSISSSEASYQAEIIILRCPRSAQPVGVSTLVAEAAGDASFLSLVSTMATCTSILRFRIVLHLRLMQTAAGSIVCLIPDSAHLQCHFAGVDQLGQGAQRFTPNALLEAGLKHHAMVRVHTHRHQRGRVLQLMAASASHPTSISCPILNLGSTFTPVPWITRLDPQQAPCWGRH